MALSLGAELVKARAKESELRAVITRADGTIEDLGVIAYWHRNPLRRWVWNIGHWLKGITK